MTRVHCPNCAQRMKVALVVPRVTDPSSDRITYCCGDCTIELSRVEDRTPVEAGCSGL